MNRKGKEEGGEGREKKEEDEKGKEKYYTTRESHPT